MRIALDIDSTLHHYWDDFAAVVGRRFGVALPYERQETWHIEQLEPAQLRACIAETHTEPFILAAEPYPGAVEAVRRWHAAGHWVHVTSHRAVEAAEPTGRWLERIGLPFDDLHCSYDKISRCVELGIDVLVDDSPVNLVRACEEGITAATLVHPWNRAVTARHDIVAAEDWPALERALAPVLAGAASRS